MFPSDLRLKVHCNIYQKHGYYGTTNYPRFWIVLNKEIIFDFLKDFKDITIPAPDSSYYMEQRPVYYMDIMFIMDMIQEYIETTTDVLFDYVFRNDYYGLTDIFKAADRRIGKKRLLILKDRTLSQAAKKVINVRIYGNDYKDDSQRI